MWRAGTKTNILLTNFYAGICTDSVITEQY
jgi:hypothetical protein